MSTPGTEPHPGFTAQIVTGGVRQFCARGGQSLIFMSLMDCVRALPGPLGVVMVELGDTPRESVGNGITRGQILEGLLALRDLFGQGALDVAVFSSEEGVELYLDRSGTLEIRTGGWWEPRARSLLEARGFRWVSDLAPQWSTSPVPLTLEARERVAAVCAFLDLRVSSAVYGDRSAS
jgi:hypothetical protein